MENSQENKKYGLIGTIIFHAVIVLVLFTSLSTPEPGHPYPDDIVIDFGNSETGLGQEEPQASQAPNPKPEEVEATTPPEPTQSVPVQDVVEETVTQDEPSEIAINEQKKKEIEKQKELDRKKREEDRIKKEEADRLKKIQEAKEAERQKELQRQADIIAEHNKYGSVFGKGKGQDGNGTTSGKDNMGRQDGSNTNNFGQAGLGNNGVQATLLGRSAVSLPVAKIQKNASGIVVVQVTVDRDGNVIKAVPGYKGSTTLDDDLLEAARRAAVESKFNVKHDAAIQQTGTIRYTFELQ